MMCSSDLLRIMDARKQVYDESECAGKFLRTGLGI